MISSAGIAGLGKLVGFDAPHFADVTPRLRITDRSLARQLIAFLPVLPSALAVALAGDHDAACAFTADVAGCHAKVDEAQDIFDALGVVLQAAGM